MPSCICCRRPVFGTEAEHASWGPVTLHFHQECRTAYFGRVRPRLRDAVVEAIRRWERVEQ